MRRNCGMLWEGPPGLISLAEVMIVNSRFTMAAARPTILALCLFVMASGLLAGVDGTWDLVFQTEAGDRPITLTLKSDGENVSGPVMNQEMKGTFRDGKLSLKIPDFYSPDAGMKAEFALEGVVAGDKIDGTWRFGEYSGPMKGSRAASATAAASALDAGVNGVWDFVLITEAGDKPRQVNVSVDGETVTGKSGEQAVTGSFKDGVLTIVLKDFFSSDAGFKADLKLTGKVSGKELAGSWTFGEYSGPLKGARGE